MFYTIDLTFDTTIFFPAHPQEVVLKSQAHHQERRGRQQEARRAPWADLAVLSSVQRILSLTQALSSIQGRGAN